jgi:hypothetical protein
LSNAIAKNSIQGKIDLSRAGSYPIPEWVNPEILEVRNPSNKDISVGFFASDYLLQKNSKLM